MRYAVIGGWCYSDFRTFDSLFTAYAGRRFPTALICPDTMAGCERMAIKWGTLMLVPEIHRVTVVMPVERARAILDHRPDVMVCFRTESRANEIARHAAEMAGVPVVDIWVK